MGKLFTCKTLVFNCTFFSHQIVANEILLYDFQELDDSAIQEKIDHEVCIRDGIVKLLAACHEEVQALEASKNLLTINARILALMGLLQRHRAKSVMRRKGSR